MSEEGKALDPDRAEMLAEIERQTHEQMKREAREPKVLAGER